MTLPLMGAEFLKILVSKWKKKSFDRKSFMIVCLISGVNILGLLTAQVLNLEQVEIIGRMDLVMPLEWFSSARLAVLLALSLVMNHDPVSFGLLAVLVIGCGVAAIRLIVSSVRNREPDGVLLLAVLALSVMSILAVDTLTTMLVRSIYYFMLFPLIAFLISWLFSSAKKWGKALLTMLVLVVFLLSVDRSLGSVSSEIRNRKSESAYEISTYLQENGYSTLYAAWNQGADVAVASDWTLTAGFWEYQEDPFFFYKYLCNPQVFHADSDRCVYLFYGEEDARLGIEKAKTKNIEMTQIQYFPESDIYLFTASENIMEAFW